MPKEIRPAFAHVRVGQSSLHGRGLFADRSFRKGDRVMEYGGERVGKREGTRRTEAQWAQGRVYTFELNKRWDIDGSPDWNIARLANYSCDPNCESENEASRRIWIVAKRPIAEGEEITYDYNFSFVDPPPVCRCGSPKCRGYIVGKAYLKDLRAWLERKGLPGGPGLQKKPKKAKSAKKPKKAAKAGTKK